MIVSDDANTLDVVARQWEHLRDWDNDRYLVEELIAEKRAQLQTRADELGHLGNLERANEEE